MKRTRLQPSSQGRPSWVSPLRRVRRAVRNSLRALEQSTCRLEESEHRRHKQPHAAMRQLQQAHGSLTRAAEHLGRAGVVMNEALPALAGAPAAMIELTRAWVDLAGRVAETSNRIDDASARTVEAARSRGAMVVDDITTSEVARWALMITRRYTRPWVLALDLPSLRETVARILFPRRRRPAPPAVAEGVRQVCRGRAPPRPSTCTL